MSMSWKTPSKESAASVSTYCDSGHEGCRSPSLASIADTISCSDPAPRVQFGGNVALNIRRQMFTTSGAYKPMRSTRAETEPLRDDCRHKQMLLVEAVQEAASKLGSAHPLVENANHKIKEYRSREERNRFSEVVRWHRGNIAAALVTVEHGGNLEQLEGAVGLANASELGGGHSVVLEGKAKLLLMKKERVLQEKMALVDLHASRMHAALVSGDLDMFEKTITEASKDIGSSHKVVEASRDFFKLQRAQKQQNDWGALVQLHEVEIAKTCETSNLEAIQAQIQAATSALGLGHPVVQAGKELLLQKRKCLQHEHEQKTLDECRESLSSAAAAAEASLLRLEGESIKSMEP